MAVIANVALTNTFDTWRTRTNVGFTRLNQFAINESSLYANTVYANVAFTAKGTATVTGLLTASGRATVGTNLTVSGNTTLGAAGKTMTTTGAWSHTGTQSITTNLTVQGNTTIGAAGKVANVQGWFGVAGRASVSTNLFVGGNTSVIGRMGVGTSTPVSYGKLAVITQNADATDIFYAQRVSSGTFRVRSPSGGTITVGSPFADAVNIDTANTARLTIGGTGLVTACNSLSVTQNLTISGNTTLNGTTTDRSNALSQTLTDGATINWDTSLGRVATVTLGAAGRAFAAPTNLKVGTYILRVYQDATGSRTITSWNAVFKWTAAVAPVLSTGANALDVITFFSDGTNLYGSYLPDMR
jgi:hypothetical protein